MAGIYRKLWLTYITIFAIFISVLSIILSQFIQYNLFQEKKRDLLTTSRYVNTLLIKYDRGEVGDQEVVSTINTIGESTNTRIIVLLDPVESEIRLQDEFGENGDQFYKSIEEILQGETVFKQRQFAVELDKQVVALGVPAMINEEVRGAIIIFSPVYEIDQLIYRFNRVIRNIAIFSFIIGSIAIFFVSKSISKPIILVSENAKRIAIGNKIEDIKVKPKDEIGQLINSFNYMKNELEKTEIIRRDLINGVSHELRTPLTTIKGFIEGIIDGVIPLEDQEKYLSLVLKETNRLTRLTKDLLDISKLEAEINSLNIEEISLNNIAEEVVALSVGVANSKNISLNLHIPSNNLVIHGDGDRLKQVMLNLINNGINYTDNGGKVEIRLSEDDNYFSIIIEDTGIGIPQDQIPFIFEKFYRLDKSRSSNLGGVGLGLSIVKNIVKLHGGEIHIKSQINKGTTLTVKLPK